MAVNPIRQWRLFYSRRRREFREWMDIIGDRDIRITEGGDPRITEASDPRIIE